MFGENFLIIKKILILAASIHPKFIYKLINRLENVCEFLKGIGYGAFSYDEEISSALTFHSDMKIIVDVGANVGEYSEAVYKKINPKELHIFEPSLTNIAHLNKRFKTNKRIVINNFALSNKNKKAVLYSNKLGSPIASLSKRKMDHFDVFFDNEEHVKAMRFDDYWSDKNKEIDLFKIDVEGHELEVLNGIGSLISSIKIIQFEFGGCNIDTRTYMQDFWYFFTKNNFELYRITPFGKIKISKYRESDEIFSTTNFLARNLSL